MRIAPPWMREEATRLLLRALRAAGIEARFVGGCVRDALLGHPSADIDLATPARPEDIIAALENAGIKAVPTGIAHGTITAVLPTRHFEITTLRRDVETDGRHAPAAFDAQSGEYAAPRSTAIGARTRRGAISRSTRSISIPTGPCMTRLAAWPILPRIACASSV